MFHRSFTYTCTPAVLHINPRVFHIALVPAFSLVPMVVSINNMATAVYRRDKYLGAKDKSIPNGNSFMLILTLSQTSYFL